MDVNDYETTSREEELRGASGWLIDFGRTYCTTEETFEATREVLLLALKSHIAMERWMAVQLAHQVTPDNQETLKRKASIEEDDPSAPHKTPQKRKKPNGASKTSSTAGPKADTPAVKQLDDESAVRNDSAQRNGVPGTSNSDVAKLETPVVKQLNNEDAARSESARRVRQFHGLLSKNGSA